MHGVMYPPVPMLSISFIPFCVVSANPTRLIANAAVTTNALLTKCIKAETHSEPLHRNA